MLQKFLAAIFNLLIYSFKKAGDEKKEAESFSFILLLKNVSLKFLFDIYYRCQFQETHCRLFALKH
jgi:hypothetical protein